MIGMVVRIWDGTTMHYGGFSLCYDTNGMITATPPLPFPFVFIMPSTGLVDCTGRRIYQSDILRCTADCPGTGYQKRVIYRDGAFRCGYGPEAEYLDRHLIAEDGLKVIGNAYENACEQERSEEG